jgi:hypothetical protein
MVCLEDGNYPTPKNIHKQIIRFCKQDRIKKADVPFRAIELFLKSLYYLLLSD